MTGQVGPRGLAILVLAGITGIFLAILGWSQRGTGLPAPGVRGLGGSAPASAVAGTAGVGTVPSSGRYASSGYLVWPETLGAGRFVVTTVSGRIVP
ncbi:MAG TPA: hypothetical protein VME19_21435 [Streptosporangiaceae bacterium]|nr:hypothetical protein [Streptosporangiaceae bacterium]